MTLRTFVFTAIACASAASMTALAHPGGHEDDEKLIPTTCAQLVDTERYTDDVSYPEVKALKARCDPEAMGEVAPQESDAPGSSLKDR